jgi:hypothetical protein
VESNRSEEYSDEQAVSIDIFSVATGGIPRVVGTHL